MNHRIVFLSLIAGMMSGCASAPVGPPLITLTFDPASFCAQAGQTIEPDGSITAILEAERGEYQAGQIINAMLTSAAHSIASATSDRDQCMETFSRGLSRFDAMLALQRKSLFQRGGHRSSDDPAIAAVQDQITRLWREDQAARVAYIQLKTDDENGSDYWAQRLATAHAIGIDDRSTQTMLSILNDYDWIDSKRFGGPVSAHAWILVQHADRHPTLQTLALERMTPYLETGGVQRPNYAYLWDRVAVNAGREQRYGSQPTWECDENNQLTLHPMEDPEHVNARRATMDLDTVEEGLASMAASVCLRKAR